MLLDEGLTHTVLPHDRPLEIVDIGCGTAIWAIKMCDDLPNASIRGIE
jgi:methylase of polypeptide subunit release factors